MVHWPFDVAHRQVDHLVDRFVRRENPMITRDLAQGHDVVKYHRTVATYLNAFIDTGFTITRLSEPQPTQEMLVQHPQWQDETRRPMFLLIAAIKKGK